MYYIVKFSFRWEDWFQLRYITYIFSEEKVIIKEIQNNLGNFFEFRIIKSKKELLEITNKQLPKIIIIDIRNVYELNAELINNDMFNKKIIVSNDQKNESHSISVSLKELNLIITKEMNEIYNRVPLVLNSNQGKLFIYQNDIVFIEAHKNKCTLYLNDGYGHIINHHLKELKNLLNPYFFSSSHRSYVINRNYIKKISLENGTYIIDFYSITDQALMSKAKYKEWVNF